MKKVFIAALSLGLSALTFAQKATVEVSNALKSERKNEIIEVNFDAVAKKIGTTDKAKIVVKDAAGKQIAYQVTFDKKLIFPATVGPMGKAIYTITSGTPEKFKSLVFGRFVPERKDDFAWENNVMGWRVYGPALEATGEISNGVDVWSKRTEELIIDLWFKRNSEKMDYHKDRGEGMDCYKVGRTLGGGMAAPFVKDTLWLGNNYTKYEVLENGPLRVTMKFENKPYKVDGAEIREVRQISLDAYSHFNKMTQTFAGKFSNMQAAAGIVMHKGAQPFMDSKTGILATYEPADTKEPEVYNCVGVIVPGGAKTMEKCGHYLATFPVTAGKPFVYYFGAGWSKSGIKSLGNWKEVVMTQENRLTSPLKVTVK